MSTFEIHAHLNWPRCRTLALFPVGASAPTGLAQPRLSAAQLTVVGTTTTQIEDLVSQVGGQRAARRPSRQS